MTPVRAPGRRPSLQVVIGGVAMRGDTRPHKEEDLVVDVLVTAARDHAVSTRRDDP